MSLKQKIAMLKGRESMRRIIADPYADPIVDIPMEYVNYCTKNFALQRRLSQGGTSDVFLAMDDGINPKIQYVVKRVQVDHHQAQKADLFRRELEVIRVDILYTVYHHVILHLNQIHVLFCFVRLFFSNGIGVTTSPSSQHCASVCIYQV